MEEGWGETVLNVSILHNAAIRQPAIYPDLDNLPTFFL